MCALAAVLALASSLGPLGSRASAATTHEPEAFSPIDGSGSGVTIEESSGIAVDEATGNVFITNENAVAILGGEGGAPVGLVSPFSIPGFAFGENAPAGLAYDNSALSPANGTLYVYDPATEEIKRFIVEAGGETYTEVAPPISAPGTGSFSGLGLDRQGNIYLGSFSGQSVVKFNAAGARLATYSLAGTRVSRPGQVAVDDAGDLFVQGQGNGGVYKFPANGAGQIDPSISTPVTTETATGVAYDAAVNRVLLPLGNRVVEYDATTLAKVGEFGKEGPLGEEGLLNLTARVAINEATARTYVVDTGTKRVVVFGPSVIVPTVQATAATDVIGTKATLNGTVNPEGVAVTECVFEYGETTAYEHAESCEGAIPLDSTSHSVHLEVSGLKANGQTYHYRLQARNENGVQKSADETLTTISTVTTGPATDITPESATLSGVVHPEGQPFSACTFKWGLTSFAGYEHQANCAPEAGVIPPDFSSHQVSAALSNLQSNSEYKVLLVATNAEGTREANKVLFSTTGRPVIGEVRARDATQTSAVIEAKIDPRGFATSYHFDWGPTTAYGHAVPAGGEAVGAGPVTVRAELSGLTAGASYHFRVVAISDAGTSETSDRAVETLNSCGLPDGRCLEMASPREPGGAAQVGRFLAGLEIHFQAAEEPNSLAYVVEAGLSGASRGTEVLYQASRGNESWSSTQLSPPITARNEQSASVASPNRFYGLSKNLTCGAVGSLQPMPGDPPSAKQTLEAGGGNLYRRNSDGSYTLITRQPPEALEATAANLSSEFELVGMSSDCSKVVFSTKHGYPGTGGVGVERLYEWEAGPGLRSVGWVPGSGGGEEAVEAVGGNRIPGQPGNRLNAVSEDGSRVFFSATRATGAIAGEAGKTGVFVRENGSLSKDITASETTVPDEGAEFQGATPSGARVYFTANAGLTSQSSSQGIDLYEYDFAAPEGERLTDLSVSEESQGAEAGQQLGGGGSFASVAGFADDGAHVYFIARAQLDPGEGPTYTENKAVGTFSLYDYDDAAQAARFIGTVKEGEADLKRVAAGKQAEWTSRVSADGRYILFESRSNLTSYDSGGVPEVYLYDAAAGAGEEALTCVSCREAGQPTANSSRPALLSFSGSTNPLYAPQSLVVTSAGPMAFFVSKDDLAKGAIEGYWNLYEWTHGQVFHIASEVPGTAGKAEQAFVRFAGASSDGTDLYFYDGAALNWEDPEGRPAAWDARVGGGFLPPPTPPPPCEASSEGSCQVAPVAPPASPASGTSSFTGPGNAKPKHKKHRKHKKHKKKSAHKKHKKKSAHKKHKKKSGHKKHKKAGRRGKANGRAGK